jgi:hypothetical protein
MAGGRSHVTSIVRGPIDVPARLLHAGGRSAAGGTMRAQRRQTVLANMGRSASMGPRARARGIANRRGGPLR